MNPFHQTAPVFSICDSPARRERVRAKRAVRGPLSAAQVLAGLTLVDRLPLTLPLLRSGPLPLPMGEGLLQANLRPARLHAMIRRDALMSMTVTGSGRPRRTGAR